jgi:hypothetical protein
LPLLLHLIPDLVTLALATWLAMIGRLHVKFLHTSLWLFNGKAHKCMVANTKFVKGMRLQLGGYIRCNPSYTNAIGVESMATQM